MTLELPKPSCYCKKTAYDWDLCYKCQFRWDCEYNACGYDEDENRYLDMFLLYY